MKPVAVIGVEAGAFSITINGIRYHIDQEDDPSEVDGIVRISWV